MIFHSIEQLRIFTDALAVGILLGILYDLFKLTRMVLHLQIWIIFIEDILFFSAAFMLLFGFQLRHTDGMVRAYVLLGALLGWGVYRVTVGRLFLFAAEKLFALLRRMLSPIAAAAAKRKEIVWRWIKNFLKIENILQYRLKNRFLMLYNKPNKNQKGEQAMATAQKGRRRLSVGNRMLKCFSVILLVVLAILLIHTGLRIRAMNEQLSVLQSKIAEQKLANDDLSGLLENQDEYMERMAREKLDYAAPGEEVFIISGRD